MDIGSRLRQLRKEKKLSQRDIEECSGLARTYLSQVEGGRTVPSLPTLERWAAAVEVEFYRLFYADREWAAAPRIEQRTALDRQARRLVKLIPRIPPRDQRLLWLLARRLTGGRVMTASQIVARFAVDPPEPSSAAHGTSITAFSTTLR